jgi:predicted dehydrogenase
VKGLALFQQPSVGGGAYAIALAFASGAVGTLQLNSQRIWWRNYDRIELTGQGAYLILDGLWSIKHYTQNGNTFSENYSDERTGELTGDGDALNEFVAAVREGREPIAGIDDAVKTMRLYQAVYDAVRRGQQGEIPLPDGSR